MEDSPTDRLLTLQALAQSKVLNSVNCVENGVDAMNYLRRVGKFGQARRPDLVLLDLNLPLKDGREVLSDLKADPALKMIPVIVLTTSEADRDRLHAYTHQASGFIRKPVDFVEFSRALTGLEGFWFEVVSVPGVSTFSAREAGHNNEPPTLGGEAQSMQVLLVEDSPVDSLLVRRALANNQAAKCEVTQTGRVLDAEAALHQRSFDIILADLSLPDSLGIATVTRLREASPNVPIVVLTGSDDDDTVIQALQAGATDYLVKGQVSPRAIARCARYAIERRAHQEQLRQAQKLEAVGRLAAGVAHDFNNVLSIVTGNAELLAEPNVSPSDVVAYAREIQDASSRASSLARQLLAFSRQQAMHAVPCDLNTIVGGFTGMLRRLLGPSINLETHLSSTPQIINADVSMIEQVLLNLAINARDAMVNGGKLTISTSMTSLDGPTLENGKLSRGGDFVRLIVSDMGSGMSAEVQRRIFEPFFSTKAPGAGSGLGLATVHGIVRDHSGWINVRSRVGLGSTFEVYIPQTQAALKSLPPPSIQQPKIEHSTTHSILLVEDDDTIRRLILRVLSREGYQVLAAASAQEARALWAEHAEQIRVLLTDLTLGGEETGRELAASLTQARGSLEVIYTSGFSPDFGKSDFVLEPGVNFLPKPFSLQSLLDCVRHKTETKSAA